MTEVFQHLCSADQSCCLPSTSVCPSASLPRKKIGLKCRTSSPVLMSEKTARGICACSGALEERRGPEQPARRRGVRGRGRRLWGQGGLWGRGREGSGGGGAPGRREGRAPGASGPPSPCAAAALEKHSARNGETVSQRAAQSSQLQRKQWSGTRQSKRRLDSEQESAGNETGKRGNAANRVNLPESMARVLVRLRLSLPGCGEAGPGGRATPDASHRARHLATGVVTSRATSGVQRLRRYCASQTQRVTHPP